MKTISILLLGIILSSLVSWYFTHQNNYYWMMQTVYYTALTESERYEEIINLIENNQKDKAVSKAKDWYLNNLSVASGCFDKGELCLNEEHPKLKEAMEKYNKYIEAEYL